ncbi:MAG TPA: YkvA family protein [Anaerolineales bacterium]|nr:YkvA family protein [Anaerolineales bacterium]
MAERKSDKFIVPSQGGPMRSFVQRLKLIGRLMADSRVNIVLKVLPLASLGYLFLPADLIPVVPFISALDDAAILWIGSTLFVELCPDDVVEEHMKALESNLDDRSSGDVVDAEATDLNDNRK